MDKKKNKELSGYIIRSFTIVLVMAGSMTVFSDKAAAMLMQENVNQDGGGYDTFSEEPATNLPVETVNTITNNGSDTVTVETRYITNGSSVAGYRSYNTQVSDTLWYAWNRGLGTLYPSSDGAINGWVAGLSDPNITIGYDFGVYDSTGVNRIAEGATITQGSQVVMKFSPYVSDNIFWFGTGYSMDSPYGEWHANADAPSRQSNKVVCDPKDLTQQYQLSSLAGSLAFDVYIPFSVNPPDRTLADLSGFSCGALTSNPDGSQTALCTATGIGSVTPTFNYDATYGKFYYRYTDQRDMTNIGWGGPGCYGNNIPMTNAFGQANGPSTNGVTSIPGPYVANIPSQSFAYPLTIVNNNNPPTTPTMTCPASVSVGQDITATLTSSDPDGNQLRYAVGWYSSSTPDSSWTDLVDSGTPGSLIKVGGYSTAGTYTVYGWAQDSNGASSSPSSCVVNVEPAPVVDLKINGSDGPVTVNRDSNLNITWGSVTNAVSCTGSGNNWNGAKFTTGGSDNLSASSASLYTLTCTNSQGVSASDSVSVTLQPTLKICEGSCSSSIEPPSSFTMVQGSTKNLVACFNDAVGCSDPSGDVTPSATWGEGGSNVVSLSGTAPKVLTATEQGSEGISASYSSQTVNKTATVTCTDSGACARDPRSQDLCASDTFTTVDACGTTVNCNGSKSCDYNWKEVAPK